MSKPDYFLLLDSETTQDQKVADFGAVVVNRKNEILTQCAVMIFGIYNDDKNHPLFHLFGDDNDKWSRAGLPKRYKHYNKMLDSGERSLASIGAVNKWLANVAGKYDPYLTAYNLPFDSDKCRNTNIDLTIFKKRFCLMAASQQKWAATKKYREFILENHLFTNPTDLGNMSYRTTAEAMARFITQNPDLPDEPHTALEDVIDYELPILMKLVNTTKREVWSNPVATTWRDRQVKDWFKAK